MRVLLCNNTFNFQNKCLVLKKEGKKSLKVKCLRVLTKKKKKKALEQSCVLDVVNS